MSNNDSPAPMATAAEVWRRLVKEGVLRPRNYDEDIVTLLQTQLPGSKTLPLRMDAAGWTAILASCSGLGSAYCPQLQARIKH